MCVSFGGTASNVKAAFSMATQLMTRVLWSPLHVFIRKITCFGHPSLASELTASFGLHLLRSPVRFGSVLRFGSSLIPEPVHLTRSASTQDPTSFRHPQPTLPEDPIHQPTTQYPKSSPLAQPINAKTCFRIIQHLPVFETFFCF